MGTTEMMDGMGIYGSLVHYVSVIFLVLMAFLIFFYLWHKGQLNMDEAPKYQMMEGDEERKNE